MDQFATTGFGRENAGPGEAHRPRWRPEAEPRLIGALVTRTQLTPAPCMCGGDRGYHPRVVGEYFAARPDEIDEQLLESGPEGRFEVVSAKTHSQITTATLGEILGVGDPEELMAQTETSWYGESGEYGIDAFPTALRDALATAPDLRAVAKQWTATDELKLSGWTVEETFDVLRRLARLAADAGSSGREL